MAGIEILYRDEHLIAVHKPAGMLVHRSPIDRSETVFAMQLTRDTIGRRVYPFHRLDKPTSGLLMFALHPEGARRMTTQLQGRTLRKRYLAVVRGHIDQGTVDYPLVEESDPYGDPLARPDKGAQPAVTDYRCIARTELPYPVGRYPTARYSLVELYPRTGRRHQIRRHMKHLFHPVIGDTTHGDGRHNRFFREHIGCERLLLAAVGVEFRHPFSGETLQIACPLALGFQRVIDALFVGDRPGQGCIAENGSTGRDLLGSRKPIY